MQINNLNLFPQINKNKSQNTIKTQTNPTQDVFQKSSVSFKGSELDDAFMSLFDSLLQSLSNKLTEQFDIIKHSQKETEVGGLIVAANSKEYKNAMNFYKNETFRNFNAILGIEREGIDTEYINNLFEQSGIRTVANFDNFLKTYKRNPETKNIFYGQEIEAVKIYGYLANKEDLNNFGELLLHLYTEEVDKENPNFEKLNITTSFLKKIGLNKFSDFTQRFGHLKPKFNDFESISDKVEATEYLQATYKDKMLELDKIIEQTPELKSKEARSIYYFINDIVDYFYDKNDGESLDGLSNIVQLALVQDKMKKPAIQVIAPSFNNLETVEDKVNLLEFLTRNNITVQDFNNLYKRTPISDSNPISYAENKKFFTDFISETTGSKKPIAEELYRNFADIFNAVYDSETENTDIIRTLISVINGFNIKNSDSMLQFYVKNTGIKAKSITSNEFKNFIELFNYADLKALIPITKDKNTTIIKFLEQEKEKFLAVKNDIEDFIINDETAFFIGQSSLDIYKKYNDLISQNPTEINNILQNIVEFNVEDVQQYQEKTKQIKEFSKFFETKASMYEFFSENNIQLIDSEENQKHKNNCLVILNSLYDENNKEQSLERIKNLSKTGFLINSETQLSELLEKMPDEKIRKEVLSIIADKQIPSLNSMERYFRFYSKDGYDGRKLLDYLKNIPEGIDFTTYTKILNAMILKIHHLNIPIRIDSSNMGLLNVTSYNPFQINEVVTMLNNLYETPENANFLNVMSTQAYERNNEYSDFKIAEEIASGIGKSKESYHNLVKLLGIEKADLGLKDDCAFYNYVRAIKEKLPKEFIDFVNSKEWIGKPLCTEKTPNIGLHAKLRAIDRFALNNATSIETLYSKETKEKLQKLFKTIYTTSPIQLSGTDSSNRIIADFIHESNVIEAVFTNKGEIITIINKRAA